MNASFEPKRQQQSQNTSRNRSQSAKAFPSRTIVHAKLEMTEPGDHDEREADAMADAVISGGKIARKISSGGGSSSGIAVSQQMESQLSQLQGGGRQMPEGLRSMMEGGFGQDFGQVRLHTDSEAAKMSSSIHAKAFTHGNDIYFNRGQFAPETSEGQRLIAHELTHVVQGSERVSRQDVSDTEPENGLDSKNTANNPKTYDEVVSNQKDKKDITDEDIDVVINQLIATASTQAGYKEKEIQIKDTLFKKLEDKAPVSNIFIERLLKKSGGKLNWSALRELQTNLKVDKEGYDEFNKDYIEIINDLAKDADKEGKPEKEKDEIKKGIKKSSIKKAIDRIRASILEDKGKMYADKKLSEKIKDCSLVEFLKEQSNTYYDSVYFYACDGGGNSTKYQTQLYENWALGDQWCDWFVHWCFVNAFHPLGFELGESDYSKISSSILEFTMYENVVEGYSGKYGSSTKSKKQFQDARTAKKYQDPNNPMPADFLTYLDSDGQPRKGDVVFFRKTDAKNPHHVALVLNVKGDMLYTIEGNTGKEGSVTYEEVFSEGNSQTGYGKVEGSGNGVYFKSYNMVAMNQEKNRKRKKGEKASTVIDGYGRPDYRGLLDYLMKNYQERNQDTSDSQQNSE